MERKQHDKGWHRRWRPQPFQRMNQNANLGSGLFRNNKPYPYIMSSRWLLLSLLFLLFLFLTVGIAGCKPQSTPTRPPIAVKTTTVKINTIPIFKDYIGFTKSIATVGIRARVKGFLTEMNFKEGSFVKKGQLLFVIDPKPFEAKVELAKANLAKAQANAAFQEVEYIRKKILYAKKVISKEDLDSTHAAFAEATAKVDMAKANLTEAEINLGYCKMVSPIEGKIGEKFVDVGNLVGGTEATLLANVVHLDPIYVEFSPSVSDFGEFLQYKNNAPFKVNVSLPDYKKKNFYGKVDLINNQADVNTSTILMRAIIDNPHKLLIPNIYVNVRLFLGENPQALMVPQSAVMETQGIEFVYLLDPDNKVKLQKVETSVDYQQQKVITSGLKPGDKVIINGLQKIRPGETVTTTDNNKSATP